MENKRKKFLRVFIIILSALPFVLLLAAFLFARTNLTYFEKEMEKVEKSGFTEKKFVLENGKSLNYSEGSGGEGKEPLVLIHGQSMSWKDYSRVLPELSKNYHVFAVDCHGHGGSDRFDSYTLAEMTDDFNALIEKEIQKPVILSGHSSGGIIAANMASTNPSMIKSLILEDPPFFNVLPEEMENTFAWKDGFELFHEFQNQDKEKSKIAYYFENGYFWSLFNGLGQIPGNDAREYFAENNEELRFYWYIPKDWTRGIIFLPEFDLNFSKAFYDGSFFEGVSQEEILKGIECPNLYMKAATHYGEDGVLYAANTDENAEKVMELIPNAEMITRDKPDHDIHFSDKNYFIDHIKSFTDK